MLHRLFHRLIRVMDARSYPKVIAANTLLHESHGNKDDTAAEMVLFCTSKVALECPHYI